MKILAIVVTYFPEKDLLLNNVNAFINEVDHVLIWENTPESERIQHRFVQHEKVEYCGDGINSISHALNFGWKYAKDHDYDYLLTMDQDSQWEDFSDFLHRTVYDPEAPGGIWGPLHNGVKPEVMERDTTMTSGMLIKISLINRIGAIQSVIQRTPTSIGGIQSIASIHDGHNQLWTCLFSNFAIDILGGDGKIGRFIF